MSKDKMTYMNEDELKVYIHTRQSKNQAVIFDTETTGLPPKRVYSINGFLNSQYNRNWWKTWPHIVQISWIVFDFDTKKVVKVRDHILRLEDGVVISKESEDIHKITNEMMREQGEDSREILRDFVGDMRESKLAVAHNFNFDASVIAANACRYSLDTKKLFDEYFCTMKKGVDVTKITRVSEKTGNMYYKSPKLSELFEFIFIRRKLNQDALHNSLVDVYVCLCCFAVMKLGINPLQTDDTIREFIEGITDEVEPEVDERERVPLTPLRTRHFKVKSE